MQYVLCALIGYLVGMVNPAYILAKIHGFDIRERGSGNAGASNALILFGKMSGVLCAAFDIAKAAGVVWLTRVLIAEGARSFAVTASACILGHIFPLHMGFRGGKGLSCLAGVILAYDLRVFGIMLACAVLIALISGYICFVPMTAAVAFPVVYGCMTPDAVGVALLLIVAGVVILRHTENLRRIRAGRELRLSYLWNKERERERMRAHYARDEWEHLER